VDYCVNAVLIILVEVLVPLTPMPLFSESHETDFEIDMIVVFVSSLGVDYTVWRVVTLCGALANVN